MHSLELHTSPLFCETNTTMRTARNEYRDYACAKKHVGGALYLSYLCYVIHNVLRVLLASPLPTYTLALLVKTRDKFEEKGILTHACSEYYNTNIKLNTATSNTLSQSAVLQINMWVRCFPKRTRHTTRHMESMATF